MEKTATLNLRVNPTVKKRAEEVLAQLGISMSTAIDIYLNQISLTGGIPFAVTLPKAPASLNTDLMSTGEIREKLREGYDDAKAAGYRMPPRLSPSFGRNADETVSCPDYGFGSPGYGNDIHIYCRTAFSS